MPDLPIPASMQLEDAAPTSVEEIVQASLALVGERAEVS